MQNQPNINNNPGSELPKEKTENLQTPTDQKEFLEEGPAPVTPEAPISEKFNDQQTQAPVNQPIDVPPQVPTPPPAITPVTDPYEDAQKEAQPTDEMDDSWVHAVESVIEKDKGKPYEEEEDSEKLQVRYLDQRYGRKIKKED